MKDSSRSQDVLKKILRKPSELPPQFSNDEKLLEDYFLPEPTPQTKHARRGRPLVADHLKAKNFTLCLATKYLAFLDSMKMKDKKIQGRGRKIRFIIDQFVEMHRRQKLQLLVVSESLVSVDLLLKGYSSQVKKGQKLNLTVKEKAEITKATQQVKVLLTLLKFSAKDLNQKLPKREHGILAFCLNWSESKESK